MLLVLLFFFGSAKFLSIGAEHFNEVDKIIVLGYPCTEEGSLSPMQRSRIDEALKLIETTQVDKIIFTGGAAHNEYVESQVMREYAIKKGVASNEILIETASQTTYENAKFTAQLVNDRTEQFLLVTSHFHTRRARLIFSQHFPNLQITGADYPEETSILERAGAIIHEYLGFCYYYTVQKGT